MPATPLLRLKENTLSPLSRLEERFQEKVQAVNACLHRYAYSDIAELPDISQHIIQSGGKRLRPLLTLASAELCGYSGGDRDIRLAACIELLHTATLLHDDVVDESEMRRGQATAHKLWGNQLSILGGDFLFSKMFELLVQDGSLEILNLFVKTTQTLIEGEVLQIKNRLQFDVDEAFYFRAIECKTASLFQTSLELGGCIAGSSDLQRSALKEYAYNIGMAFQIIDDLLDYTSDLSVLGKTVGNDFFEGQVTLPLIYLRQIIENQNEDLYVLRQIFAKELRSVDNLAWIQEKLEQYEVPKKMVDISRAFAHKAYLAIHPLPEHPVKEMLSDLTEFVVERCN